MSAQGIRAGRAFVQVAADDKPLQASLASLRGRMQAFGRGLAQIGAGVAAAGAGVAASLAWPVKLAADLQTTSTAFETMLGSGVAVKALMAELRAFAAATPFEFPELANAARMMIAFGSSSSGVVGELKMLGDIAAGVGIPLSELAEIYGKNRVQGRLFAEDMNQLTGRGIPIIQELAKQFGVTDAEVRQLVTEGKVGFDNLRQAMESLSTTGIFAGGMERQSKTLAGLWSTLKDSIAEALLPIGEMLLPILSSAIQQTTEWVSALGQVIQGFTFVTAEIVGIDMAWSATTNAMRDQWYAVVDTILDTWSAASNGIAAAIGQTVGFFRKSWEVVTNWFSRTIDWIQTRLKQSAALMAGLIKGDMEIGRQMAQKLGEEYKERATRQNAQSGLRRAEIDLETEEYLKTLSDMAEEERAARLANRSASVSAAEQALKNAEEKLAEFKKAEALKTSSKTGVLSDAASDAKRQTDAITGAFNASLAGQQVGIKQATERTAKATEKTVKLLEKIAPQIAMQGILVGM